MILRVLPSTLTGDSVWAPPSKSIMQRVVAVATMAEGTTMIRRPSESDDCTHALMMAAQLGAEVELGEHEIAIHGIHPLAPRSETITPGESGLGFRMFGVMSSLHNAPLTFQREGSLSIRNMSGFANALTAVGVRVVDATNNPNVMIQGPLRPGSLTIDAAGSSQVLSGLLAALPYAQGPSRLTMRNVVSRPYLDMTLEVLEDMGICIDIVEDHIEQRSLIVNIEGNQRARGIDMTVDGDWSAASYLLALGALCSRTHLDIEGLQSTYTQADEAIKGALLFGGCTLAGTEDGVRIRSGFPREFHVDLTDCPDLFPPLAVLAAFAKKPSELKGLHRLANKESNRGKVIQQEWAKVGIKVELDEELDVMRVYPGTIQSARIDAHGDHRIAMAAAIFGAAGAIIEIANAESVAKSYPAFFDDLKGLGVQIQTVA